jgi:hypothetical protein
VFISINAPFSKWLTDAVNSLALTLAVTNSITDYIQLRIGGVLTQLTIQLSLSGPVSVSLSHRAHSVVNSLLSIRRSAVLFCRIVGLRDSLLLSLPSLSSRHGDTGTALMQSISIFGPPVRRAAKFVAAYRFHPRPA